MKREERLSYMILFCTLLLARRGTAILSQSLKMVPLTGGAERLAAELRFPGGE